ncbi:restriction modification system S chain-like protein [Streptomyces sp. NBRC 14336]|uniref:restriction endonuclease subunit S n=1 Tax=Streptomyces sp. NBRC 14336 TaxID=3030992 RepID=UPI0024A1C42A|nr:restriction endonuclease subunit S [Streptomyces sp. NBRC 14336]GLW51172.1 restriction modification system S chain-like protein [Streptomyces sp. NBRC 14336]
MTATNIAPWLAQSRWPTVPIRLVARLGSGHTPSRSVPEYWENCTVPWITLADVWQLRSGNVSVISETKEKVSPLGLAHSAAVKHPAGTVILSRTASVGFSAIMGTDMATSQDFATWTCGPRLEPRFLLHALRGMAPDLTRVATGSTHKTIYMPDIEQLRVPLPPLEEQRRIADFLDAETARIDRLQRLRTRHRLLLAERTRRAIQELAVGRGLPTSSTENPWIREIPDGWAVLPLKRRWHIIDCKHRTPEYVAEGYPVVSPGDISPGRLDLAGTHRFVSQQDFEDLADDLRRPRRGDIVYSRNASVGIAAYVDTEAPFTMGQDVCRITSPDQDQLFLTYVLNSVALAELESLQVGSTFTRVNIGTLLNLSVPCPPPDQQRDIARRMDEASAMGSALDQKIEQQLALLTERRQALITAAVTGQFDVSTASGRNVTDGVTA